MTDRPPLTPPSIPFNNYSLPDNRIGMGSRTVLPMTEDEKKAAAEREAAKPTFGFARELDEEQC